MAPAVCEGYREAIQLCSCVNPGDSIMQLIGLIFHSFEWHKSFQSHCENVSVCCKEFSQCFVPETSPILCVSMGEAWVSMYVSVCSSMCVVLDYSLPFI